VGKNTAHNFAIYEKATKFSLSNCLIRKKDLFNDTFHCLLILAPENYLIRGQTKTVFKL